MKGPRAGGYDEDQTQELVGVPRNPGSMELPSRIDSVTVFRQGAEVVRQAEIGPDAPPVLRLGGLPLALLDHSLQVRVVPLDGGLPPLAVDLRVELEAPPSRPPETDRADAMALARAEKALVEAQLTRLESLEPAPHQPPSPPVSLAARRRLLAFRHAQVQRLRQRLRQLESDLESGQEGGSYLQSSSFTKAAVLRLQRPELGMASRCRLELRYQVRQACWAPAYVLRLDRDLTMMECLMRALVQQETGEDWSEVNLRVSTADLSQWREVPELRARRIGRRQPAPQRLGWREPPPNTDALFADFDRDRRMAPPPPPPPDSPLEYPDADLDLYLPAEVECCELAAPPPQVATCASTIRVDLLPTERRGFSLGLPSVGGLLGRARHSEGGQSPAAAPEEPAELIPGKEHLLYSNLRMPHWDEPQRGTLRPQDLQQWARRRGWDHRHLADFQRALQRERERSERLVSPPAWHYIPENHEGFDYLYEGEARVRVVGDGHFHSVPVLLRNLPLVTRYEVVPREALEVFRVAQAESLPNLAWPAGPADVYVAEEYLLSTRLDTVGPGGHWRIGLGAEEGVRVSRNVRFSESVSGMMGGLTHLRHEVEIEVVNNKSHPISLQIWERLPEPPDPKSEIRVSVEKSEPPWEKSAPPDQPELEQAYCWKLEIPACERYFTRLTYVIEIPSRQELRGGNRREPS